MLELQAKNKKDRAIHDINASLSALQGAIELIHDEWRNDPELVDRILPLTFEKLDQLQTQITNFHLPKSSICD